MMSEGAPERPEALSKADAVKSLRETIQQLDRVARRLESATIEALPPTTALTRLAEDLQTLEADLAPIAPALRAADVAKATAAYPPERTADVAKTTAAPPSQRGVFAKVRSLLPAPLGEKLSNGALAGILAGLTAAVIAGIALLIPHPPQRTIAVTPSPTVVEVPVTVAPSPTVVEVPVTVAPSPTVVEVPVAVVPAPSGGEAPATVAPSPTVVEVPVTVAPSPSVVEVPVAIVPSPALESPPESSLEEPVAPVETPIPSEIATPSEEPIVVEAPPEPILTPEQRLISAIQTQVAQITSQYADGLIESIQADFLGSRLAVSLKDEWYNLTADRQDRVAREMWTRSQELDFSKLELTDGAGHLLARSPVVGQEMAVFLRQRL